MKNIIIVFIMIILVSITGCQKKAAELENISQSTIEKITTEALTAEQETTKALTVEERRANAEINVKLPLLRLYMRDAEYSEFNLADKYENQWIYYSDIGGFYTFAADENKFPYAGFTDKWFEWWNSYEEHEKAKTGFEVIVTLNDGTKLISTIKSPKDTEQLFSYVELYLYDDVHQKPGAWYSHLLEEQMTDESLMTSIKVTTGEKIEEVKSIFLTVFVYSGDADFDDSTGRYIGGNYTELEIGRQ